MQALEGQELLEDMLQARRKVPGGDPRKCRETAVNPGKAWHRAMQGGWVGFEMKPQVWVKEQNGQRIVRFTTCPKHKGKETLSVNALLLA